MPMFGDRNARLLSKAKSECKMASKLDLLTNIEGSPWSDQQRTRRVLVFAENVLGIRRGVGCS